MTTLLIATRNRHKVAEIRALLDGNFRWLTLDDFPGAPKTIEDRPTFAGNAAKKALELAAWIRQLAATKSGETAPAWPALSGRILVLADDSGLEVDALDGAPGVHSARFAALDARADNCAVPTGNSPDADNNAKLLRLLRDVPAAKRTARFRCVIAAVECRAQASLLTPHLFEGTCEGRIAFTPSGQGGFGYDPLFVPEGFGRSFAELGEKEKNRISHRARAVAKLAAWLASGASR
jgi:XTP/dITP diphosphohydrolase